MYSPILISVYNRLLKLRDCIYSLLSNKEAQKTDLYIAIDFPYRKEDEGIHKDIIDYCKKIKGFKSINLIVRETNFGSQQNMAEAMLQLFNIYPYLINIEDDNVVSPNYLDFMNNALKLYEDDNRIYCVTGYNYPVQMPFEYKHSAYLWPGVNGHGIGWWKSKYKSSYLHYNNLFEFLTNKSKVTEFFNMANHILPIMFSGLKKGVTYGDAALSYNLFLNNQYQLYPTVSKVRDTGHDGSGLNCGVNDIYTKQPIDDGSGKIEFIKGIQPDKRIYNILSNYLKISEPAKLLLEKDIEEYLNVQTKQFRTNQIQDKQSIQLNSSSLERDSQTIAAITVQEAVAALTSVGRSPLPAFQKFKRPQRSSPQMDAIENRWWNIHGELVEKVWSLQDALCDTLRRHYLEKAKKFFLEGSSHVKVLELGCGSGWLGRILADESFQIIGSDFSETQIQLAKERARPAGNEKFCTYYCTATLKSIPGIHEVAGVIMHAFLHHLYGDELAALFSELQQLLPSNAKMFILEPVYHQLHACANAQVRSDAQIMSQGLFAQMEDIKQQLIKSGKYDTETADNLSKIVEESNTFGYFFSPKEVPFDSDELRALIGKYATIKTEYLTGLFDTDIAQNLSRITDDNLRKDISSKLMPLVQFIDNFLIENRCIGDFAGGRYIFTAYECEFSPILNNELDNLNINHSVETKEISKEVNNMLFNYSKNFFGPVILNPGTLSRIATDAALWQEILSFHSSLATDEYVQYLDAFYRESIKRFGPNWFYLDIVNVLYAASRTVRPRTYLEIGVRRGRSVCTVARGCPNADVVAFDMWLQGYGGMENPGPEFVKAELLRHGHTGTASFINGNSHQTIPAFFSQNPQAMFDMITVDGDHSEAGALDDLRNVIPHLSVGGILVFDDIAHPSHPYLFNVWKKAMAMFPFLTSFEFTELGYGVAFAIRKGE
jgi:predicted O-methyltransferase YrrM/2-polyprenyl-3-methyl-5-hydroxy-6-metoxy-1,4-benzoquinol methylase